MVAKIIIPIIIASFAIALQLTIIPLIAVKFVIPNIVIIFVVLYALRFGQISGTLFGFTTGFLFDIASVGIIGSGMFAFTIASFIAGYFQKEDFYEVLYSPKIFLPVLFLSATLFFLLYTILGAESIGFEQNYSFIFYSILCGAYTTVVALVIYIFPKLKL